MGHTDNSVEFKEGFSVDVGEADIFLGTDFERPWFFDTQKWKMMEAWSPKYVHIKTWRGEIYQFRLYRFHNSPAMLITSTLEDTFIVIKSAGLSIKGTMAKARKAKKYHHPAENSFSGYWTWGKYFEDQYARLKKNMKNQRIFFSDEALKAIYDELLRRKNEENG